ncbi:MAG: N-acetyltransferase [Deltaproteobacteria bacterium]|nr:N-acetyltransferase [Deltaproteobacteria bacterium]MBW2309307.1 N-acetyltransferase [Deltaproteobacteria bacterium]
MIRKARVTDVRAIHKMLDFSSRRNELLARSLSELYDNLRDFFVYTGEEPEHVIGTCAMHICWEDLAEIRSLCVLEEYQGRGIGTKLVEACISEAITLNLFKVFVLTYRPDFFRRLEFSEVDKATLPHKIWADCVRCVKFPECDEVAMILNL